MCNCINLVNEDLSRLNAAIDVPHRIDLKTGQSLAPIIPVPLLKLNPKKREQLPMMLSIFCPFCGVRYEPAVQTKEEGS